MTAADLYTATREGSRRSNREISQSERGFGVLCKSAFHRKVGQCSAYAIETAVGGTRRTTPKLPG